MGASGKITFRDCLFHKQGPLGAPQDFTLHEAKLPSGTHTLCDAFQWKLEPQTKGERKALKKQRILWIL